MLLLHRKVQTVPTSASPYRGIFLQPITMTVLGTKSRGQQRLRGRQPDPGVPVPGPPGPGPGPPVPGPGIPGMDGIPPGGMPVGFMVPPGSVTPEPSTATQVGISPIHIPVRPQITFVGPFVRNPGGQMIPQDSPPCPGVQTPTRYPPGGAIIGGHVDLAQKGTSAEYEPSPRHSRTAGVPVVN